MKLVVAAVQVDNMEEKRMHPCWSDGWIVVVAVREAVGAGVVTIGELMSVEEESRGVERAPDESGSGIFAVVIAAGGVGTKLINGTELTNGTKVTVAASVPGFEVSVPCKAIEEVAVWAGVAEA